jgi:predicted nucleic acid-binding protein
VSVLVDSTIWSLALRRKPEKLSESEQALVQEWRSLVRSDRALICGVVRQEVLSGVRHEAQFEKLRDALEPHQDIPLEGLDYVQAARFYNRCQSGGVAGGTVDMLLCALADRMEVPVFTTDGDFEHYARHLSLRLHAPRKPA